MRNFLSIVAALTLLTFSITQVDAQTLYKHVDKDGKVTYSDKPPKEGEGGKLSKVTVDTTANVTKHVNKDNKGNVQKFSDVKARGDERISLREKLQGDIKTAEKALESAKKALADGREPLEGETRIVVGKNSNSVQRTPDYHERVAKLEDAVKNAEGSIKKAEERYARGAPD